MQILFFSQLKDVTRCDGIELDGSSPLTADMLWTELLKRFPLLTAHRSSTRLAKNLEYAAPDTVFSAGDEVALIPPVSGG